MLVSIYRLNVCSLISFKSWSEKTSLIHKQTSTDLDDSYVTDVVFLINFDGNELTRFSISVSRCTKVVLDSILSGFKPKVGNSLSFVNFRK